uniref:Uncharacterized protein n=1 Tax=Candidatus Kentrum sp. TC TaxID=2126339 RepID=A0A451A4Q6_9GAMM|nr:MAG: hypothetical protein BECKTC1821E_GA0114239_104415 [Candidatus Kentron sp. TC]VFK61016.1 MAG: hypothetical protein BECKTC1821F_GA0114240_105215 [Candidatus Kentron sp. TC]
MDPQLHPYCQLPGKFLLDALFTVIPIPALDFTCYEFILGTCAVSSSWIIDSRQQP